MENVENLFSEGFRCFQMVSSGFKWFQAVSIYCKEARPVYNAESAINVSFGL